MKAIIKNGVVNKDIQSCLISECGVHGPKPMTTTRAYGTCKAIRCRLQDTEGLLIVLHVC